MNVAQVSPEYHHGITAGRQTRSAAVGRRRSRKGSDGAGLAGALLRPQRGRGAAVKPGCGDAREAFALQVRHHAALQCGGVAGVPSFPRSLLRPSWLRQSGRRCERQGRSAGGGSMGSRPYVVHLVSPRGLCAGEKTWRREFCIQFLGPPL